MHQKRRVHVLDSYISYLDTRAGEETVIFLHGSMSYSFTWRSIIPRVDGYARCLAPDLIGHGDSGRDPDDEYTFQMHYDYFDAWIQATSIPDKVILVGHEWGATICALWAARNADRVKAFVHFEGVFGNFTSLHDLGLDDGTLNLFVTLRDPDNEEARSNAYKTDILAQNLLQRLTIDKKLGKYDLNGILKPYQSQGAARKAAISWINQLPVQDQGRNGVLDIMKVIQSFMSSSPQLEKLLIRAEPGSFTSQSDVHTAKWSSQRNERVAGGHFPHEDDPERVGDVIGDFVRGFARAGFKRP